MVNSASSNNDNLNIRFSSYNVRTDVKFSPTPGQGSLGAVVCLSFFPTDYIRIEFQSDKICFSPAKEVADDDCFYSSFVSNESRIFIPQPFIDCYRTPDGDELINHWVKRISLNYGYGLEVKRIKDFSIKDFGISFRNETPPNISFYEEQQTFTYKTRTQVLGNYIKNYRKSQYYEADVYFGEKPCVTITPAYKLPQIQPKENLTLLFGKHFQNCNCPHVEFYTTFENNIIPSEWYKRFANYRNRIFTISVNNAEERILIQATDEYMNDNISPEVDVQELLNRLASMEKSFEEISAENLRLKSEINMLNKNGTK